MQYRIREITGDEPGILNDFLYEAIFIPEGAAPPPGEIIYQPELQVYVADFGRHAGDLALIAEADRTPLGACWTRIMEDYGHIDDETPSLAISLYPEYRGKGIGTALLLAMLDRLKAAGYRRVSLSVQKENAAVRLYRRTGFAVVRETDEEYIMVCGLM